MQNTLNDGLFTVSEIPSPLAIPFTKFVFPVPRSPDSEIAKSAGRVRAKSAANPEASAADELTNPPAQPAHCPFEIHQTREQNLAMRSRPF